ncbi:hypothetical protein [Anaerospora hongkongensis]|nr:hypothetical protein [Anaerospora hongkongensis]
MECIGIVLALAVIICARAIPRKTREYWELVNVRTKEKRRV